MQRFLVVATLALIVPVSAFAKGPTAATITGPGVRTISISGDAENGMISTFNQIVQGAGFFPAVFRPVPDPMLHAQPRVELGPRYRITWIVPTGSNTKVRLRQDVYPYAKPYAVTYMRPGQPIFDMTTNGGWYAQTADLRHALVSAGLPARPPSPGDDGFWTNAPQLVGVFGGIAAAVLAAAAAFALIRRRRLRPAAGS